MKYELTSEKKYGLSRIRALRDFGNVMAGDLGGWVEDESNLSQEGTSWVSGNARVSGNAGVYGDAHVYGNAWVFDNAWVSGDAEVSDNAWVFDNAHVSGDACVFGNARVYGDAHVSGNAQVYGNARVSGNAQVYGNEQVSGTAWVSGVALITKVNLTAVRSDNYTFSVVSTSEGVRVIAGSRYFSFEQAREQWAKILGGTPLGEETFALLDLLEAQARIHNL